MQQLLQLCSLYECAAQPAPPGDQRTYLPRAIVMPTITNMRCNPAPAALDIEISLRVPSAGPVTIRIALDEELPYYFITSGKQVRELSFTRIFGSAGDHITRFMIALANSSTSHPDPSVTVTAAGIDGSSGPVTVVLAGQ